MPRTAYHLQFCRTLFILIAVCCFLLISNVASKAKEIRLQAGESYRDGELTVICRDQQLEAAPIQMTECQYWDDFKKTCLFEKHIQVYKNIRCVEECQHWEKFKKRCSYQTRCTFYPGQHSFVREDCLDFDDFEKKCLRTNDSLIEQ